MRCSTLADLPPPPEGKTGWPWTEDSPQLPEKMPDGREWPKVSIVTPSFNQGVFIEETIRSVLLQGYPNLEYIIMDGGSTDESIDIIRKYESWITFWVSEPDSGQSNAINKGFKMATGEIVAWLNSDDLYTAGAIITIVKVFLKDPGRTIVYGDCDIINETSRVVSHQKARKFELKKLYYGNIFAQPASFMNAIKFNKVGFLDESLHYSMDYDLWMRLGYEHGGMQYIAKTLALFRLHGNSKSVSQRKNFYQESTCILDKFLRLYSLDRSILDSAYSNIFKNCILYYSSNEAELPARDMQLNSTDTPENKLSYHKKIRDIHALINNDELFPRDIYRIQETLGQLYQAFENEYNKSMIVSMKKSKYQWIDEQLVVLPDYLFSLGKKEKAIYLYKKTISARPCLLRYHQTHRFIVRSILRSNYISKWRGQI